MANLIIVRGLPGSGKSTFAQELKKRYKAKHYEADMFHLDENGEYKFDPTKIGESHSWCQHMVYSALKDGFDAIVSNTFTQLWEMVPYLDLSEALGVKVEIIEAKETFGNIHNVPENILEMMKNRWEECELDGKTYSHIVGVTTVSEKRKWIDDCDEKDLKNTLTKIRNKMLSAGGVICPHCKTMWEDDRAASVCPCLDR